MAAGRPRDSATLPAMSDPNPTVSSPRTFEPSYAALPSAAFTQIDPTPVKRPRLLRLNRALARDLGLDPAWCESEEGIQTLAGNRRLGNAVPLAMAYAGHQFGNWVPSLGDGRALLIGETVDTRGVRRDLQLKGSGPTPFSRRGDGRAAIGPVLREYVVSEAMHALGIPTTRALAMVTTGETVLRERAEPGAVLTRVAQGFVRVGTFEYFQGRGQTDLIRALADYVIERRYPEAAEARNPYRALLDRVIECQADLIARWLLVGFIHGVMNTDNMSIFGETIDYGPCAFLDGYEASKVFSSIDRDGRYAYDQQPGIGLWNLTRFAETLLPLLADDEEAAIESAKEALGAYAARFQRSYDEGLCRKLGLPCDGGRGDDAARDVARGLLDTMAAQRADFTLTFRGLGSLRRDDVGGDAAIRSLFEDPAAFDGWVTTWRALLVREGVEDGPRIEAMRATNPAFIPRNHRIEQAIRALVDHADEGPLDALLEVTGRPFDEHPDHAEYAAPPAEHEVVHRTFCGT